MKISKLIIMGMVLSMALPAAAASSKNPLSRKKARKPAAVKLAEAAPAAPATSKVGDADPTKSWQAYSFP